MRNKDTKGDRLPQPGETTEAYKERCVKAAFSAPEVDPVAPDHSRFLTVRELIARLQTFDPNATVAIASMAGGIPQLDLVSAVRENGGPQICTDNFEEYKFKEDKRASCTHPSVSPYTDNNGVRKYECQNCGATGASREGVTH